MFAADYYNALRSICRPIHASAYPRSLAPMRHLLNALDDPQRAFPAVVVAGSVGKGTTCQHIARLLRAGGQKVGVYTSPHLHSFRERIVINGEKIGQEAFIEGAEAVCSAISSVNHRFSPTLYSTFEQTTALALWWFAQQRVDLAVLEIGIGGRWDAVNAVPNTLAVFAPIESEHLSMLGGSLQSIAWQKAGILRSEGWAISVQQTNTVAAALQHEADQKRARLLYLENGKDTSPQESAAYLAVKVYQNLLERRVFNRSVFRITREEIVLPGRMEQARVGGRSILIDGGHTPLAAHALRDTVESMLKPGQRARLVIGMLRDKAAEAYLTLLDSARFHIVLTQAPGHRAFTPELLARSAVLEHAHVEIQPNLSAALAQAQTSSEALFVIGGSLRMAAAAREAYGLLTEDELAEAQATRTIFEGDDYLAKLHSLPGV